MFPSLFLLFLLFILGHLENLNANQKNKGILRANFASFWLEEFQGLQAPFVLIEVKLYKIKAIIDLFSKDWYCLMKWFYILYRMVLPEACVLRSGDLLSLLIWFGLRNAGKLILAKNFPNFNKIQALAKCYCSQISKILLPSLPSLIPVTLSVNWLYWIRWYSSRRSLVLCCM